MSYQEQAKENRGISLAKQAIQPCIDKIKLDIERAWARIEELEQRIKLLEETK